MSTSPTTRSRDQRDQRDQRLLYALGWVALASLVLWAWINRPATYYPPGSAVQYDDFAFRIVGTREAELGGKRYIVVQLRVENRAVRVSYQFDRAIVHLIGPDGRWMAVSDEGQRRLEAARGGPNPCAERLPAGTNCTDELVFDLPPDQATARLVIHHSGWIGALLDDIVFGKRYLRLR